MSEDLSIRAAEYALGTLDPDERAAFARLLATDPAARAALSEWEERLSPIAEAVVAPVEPSPELWDRIEREVDSISSGGNVVQLKRAPRWGLRTAMLGAMAAGLAVVAVVSMPTQQAIVKPGSQQVAQADPNANSRPAPAPSVATASATANSASATVTASAPAPQGNGSVATASAAAPQGNGSVATASAAAPQGNGSVATASAAAPQGNGSVATASAAAPQGNGSVATASATRAPSQGAGVSLAIGGGMGGISVGGEQRPAAGALYFASLAGSAAPELTFRVDPAAGALSVSRVGGDLSRSLEVWILPAGGAPVAVGFLAGPSGSFPLPANIALDSAEIAVSVETQALPPDAAPQGPFILRGRLARE